MGKSKCRSKCLLEKRKRCEGYRSPSEYYDEDNIWNIWSGLDKSAFLPYKLIKKLRFLLNKVLESGDYQIEGSGHKCFLSILYLGILNARSAGYKYNQKKTHIEDVEYNRYGMHETHHKSLGSLGSPTSSSSSTSSKLQNIAPYSDQMSDNSTDIDSTITYNNAFKSIRGNNIKNIPTCIPTKYQYTMKCTNIKSKKIEVVNNKSGNVNKGRKMGCEKCPYCEEYISFGSNKKLIEHYTRCLNRREGETRGKLWERPKRLNIKIGREGVQEIGPDGNTLKRLSR